MDKRILVNIVIVALIGLIVANMVKGMFKGTGFFSFLSLNRGQFDFTMPNTADGSKNSGLSKDEINRISEMQFDAMDRLGTDFDLLKKSLYGLNGKALQEVAVSFGKRRYSLFEGTLIVGDMLNLFQWYNKELTERERDEIAEIWSKSGLYF